MRKQKIVIFLTVLIDVLGLGLVVPIMPLYVEKFGASPFLIAAFFSIYSLFQFVASPVLGALSDKYGRRPVLIISLFGTAIGWFIFALANNMILLFIGRILDGITGGNISTAQSYLVDLSKTPKERTENLGLIGMAFGIGFIMGPAIGGVLSHFGITVPFLVAGLLALFNTIAAYFVLPETNLNKDHSRKVSYNPLKPIVNGMKNARLRVFLIAWLMFSMAITLQQSIFTLFINRQFGFNETVAGYLMTLVGVIVLINQGFLLRRVWLKRFAEPFLELASMAVMVVSFIGFSVGILWAFIAFLILFAFSHSVLRVVTNSQIVGMAEENKKGEVIGLTQGLMSLASIIMPLIGGFLFEINIHAPWILAAAIMLMTFIMVLIERRLVSRAKLSTEIPPTV